MQTIFSNFVLDKSLYFDVACRQAEESSERMTVEIFRAIGKNNVVFGIVITDFLER